MSTPKREKRPPKRYADSPVLLVNKKKKEQKPPAAGVSPEKTTVVTLAEDRSTTSPKTATPGVRVLTPATRTILLAGAKPVTPLPVVLSAVKPTAPPGAVRTSLSSTTAALAARLSAEPTAALAALPPLAPVYSDSAPNSGTSSPVPTESQDTPPAKVCPIFKDPNFVHSTKGASGGKRVRVWKNLKQIVTTERSMPWKPDDVTYGSLDAPPSFFPAKKYSDITGLPAKYTDPHSKIRYATTEEFRRIRTLKSDIATGYLTLRKANVAV